jgi:hypothetical protein
MYRTSSAALSLREKEIEARLSLMIALSTAFVREPNNNPLPYNFGSKKTF